MNQKLTEIILHNNGFETMIAENGRIAVDVLRQQAFDLILMDIQMPVMDGYKATCAIRDDLHIFAPIIAMTAHALDGEKDNCIHQGMNDYISKPFKEDDLLQKIAYWLSKAATKATAAPGHIIDFSFLRQQTRNNITFIREMISIFREQNPADIARLKAAVSTADFPAVYHTTHMLRNTIGFFGLNNIIGSQLQQMEKLARAGEDIDAIAGLFREVKLVFEQAVGELAGMDLATFS